jgi:carboxyl-terminal processing protease
MLGRHGTRITLSVRRPGEGRQREFVLTRGPVALETVHGRRRKLDASWDHFLERKRGIGYVRLSRFTPKTAGDLLAVLARLRNEGMKGLVLDLRFNPGGLLASTADVAGLFLKEGPVVTIKAREDRCEEMRTRGVPPFGELPLVVLINEESASGSEILAACLQDHKRAAVVGARSLGRGAIQNIQDFHEGGMRITIASLFSPDGRCLHRYFGGPDDWGVRPDRGGEVLLSRAERDELHERLRNSELVPHPGRARPDPYRGFRDTQLERACEVLRARIASP